MLARDHAIARTEVVVAARGESPSHSNGSVVRQPRRLCRCRRSWPDAVDLLDEGADYLRDFRCRARVACPDQLVDLIAAALSDTAAEVIKVSLVPLYCASRLVSSSVATRLPFSRIE
jgi:hypothetical protein